MPHRFCFPRLHHILLAFLVTILIAGSAGCLPLDTPQPSTQTPPSASPTPMQEAMVTFRVKLPQAIPAGDSVYLSVLDEVTGLALNPKHYIMEAADAQTYIAVVPFPLGTVVKYRYTRQGGTFVQEHISDGRAVHYRLFQVDGPGLVEDILSRWTDTSFASQTGRIEGQVVDSGSGLPVAGLLVTAGGAQTLTASDGTFLLEGLPAGTHNLVAYSLDGAYHVYQQGAVVAQDATTPARLLVRQAERVQVVFRVSVPAGTVPPTVPVRLAGNLYQLGNTYGDLLGGVSTVAARIPELEPLSDGRYSITLDLPVGADVRYKYTLGDGIWNAEHDSTGAFRVRQLIVPGSQHVIEDQIHSWSTGNSAPITFDVNVPPYTPSEEIVSIQFNPGFGWMEPLPMWPAGSGRWIFILYSPLETVETIQYRYCRNDQCGSSNESRSMGRNATGRTVSTGLLPQTMDDVVEGWTWLDPETDPITLPNTAIHARGPSFLAGVTFSPAYHPTWTPYLTPAVIDVKSLNAGWVILQPTWSFTRVNLPVLEPVPGRDPLWLDLGDQLELVKGQTLKAGLYPTVQFPTPVEEWWASAARDFSWWQVWFARYRSFILNYADLAEQQGVSVFVLGGDWLAPALPGGQLSDTSPSGVPADAELRWRDLIREIRSRYKGTLLWAMSYPGGLQSPPAFLDSVDQLYVEWSAPVAAQSGTSDAELASQAGEQLDSILKPVQEQAGKPVVLALAYPSAKGALNGCVEAAGGGCWSLSALSQPNPDLPEVSRDLQEQVQAYNAILLAVNERDWIHGLVSAGYYPPAILQDKSISIHGKPARGVLWYWFPLLTGAP